MTMKSLAAVILGLAMTTSVALAADSLTSVSQLKDVPTSEPYFQDIQSLIERYGALEANTQGISNNTYRPAANITKAEFAMMLLKGLDQFKLMMVGTGAGKSPLNLPTPKASTKMLYSDVKPGDATYAALDRLAVMYGITFGSADKKFNPQETVTQQQAAGLFRTIFGITTLPVANKPLTRGEMAMYLNQSLNFATDAFEKTLPPEND